MSQQLVSKLAPRLKNLGRGGYERGYRSGRKVRLTSTHQLIGDLLDSLKIRYREDVPMPGSRGLRADFLVNGTYVLVEGRTGSDLGRLSKSGKNVVVIKKDALRSDGMDHGLRVVGLGEESGLQTIFLDDPSFNFDYAHILPRTQKCSVMHGHTSSVLVEIVGRPKDGMVVDFGDAKRIVKEAVAGLDHKLFINERYVTQMDPTSVGLSFKTVHGDFAIRAPRGTTVLLDGEATVENLAREVLAKIVPAMPDNVTAVGVYVYEGLNKGSHILAQIHQGGVGKRTRKR